MCTVELSRRLDLGLDNLRLETLARHWGIPQTRAHDAFDDALVLSRVLIPALRRARDRDVWLPVRPVSRRRWPNGAVTHEELRPLKMLASRMPCPYLNPGRYQRGGPLVQGMRVALSAEVNRTHEELVERILHAGLAYTDAVDPETSLVICNRASSRAGQRISGPRTRRADGVRRTVHASRRLGGRRGRHRPVRAAGRQRSAVCAVLDRPDRENRAVRLPWRRRPPAHRRTAAAGRGAPRLRAVRPLLHLQ